MIQKYVIIEDGSVVNLVVANSPLAENWIASDIAQIGWTYENGEFIAPQEIDQPEELSEEELLAIVRSRMVVSKFQAKAVLMSANLLETVQNMIAESDPIIQLAWNEVVEFRRLSPVIIELGNLIGLTDEQLDELFIQAKAISI